MRNTRSASHPTEKTKMPRLKPLTLQPLEPEDALQLFMQVDPTKLKDELPRKGCKKRRPPALSSS